MFQHVVHKTHDSGNELGGDTLALQVLLHVSPFLGRLLIQFIELRHGARDAPDGRSDNSEDEDAGDADSGSSYYSLHQRFGVQEPSSPHATKSEPAPKDSLSPPRLGDLDAQDILIESDDENVSKRHGGKGRIQL